LIIHEDAFSASAQYQAEKSTILMYQMEATHTVPTPAHTSTAAVAPFRAWRGSQFRVARGPARATIETWKNQGRRWYQFRGAM